MLFWRKLSNKTKIWNFHFVYLLNFFILLKSLTKSMKFENKHNYCWKNRKSLEKIWKICMWNFQVIKIICCDNSKLYWLINSRKTTFLINFDHMFHAKQLSSDYLLVQKIYFSDKEKKIFFGFWEFNKNFFRWSFFL